MKPKERSAITVARETARMAGHHTFTVSEKCRNGHSAFRYTSSGICSECISEYRTKPKPRNERILRLANTDTLAVQFRGDRLTAAMEAKVRKRFGEIIAQPVSRSLIYKAAITVLAGYLNGTPPASDLKSLIR